MSIFLDTGFFISLYNTKDRHHPNTLKLVQQLKNGKHGQIFTSIFVLNELFTYIQRKISHQEASRLIDDWFSKKKTIGSLIPWTSDIIFQASNLFTDETYQRKPLSYTDCLIVATCDAKGISKIITFDNEFKQYLEVIQ